MPALSLLFFFVIERSVLMALVFYNKVLLEKTNDTRNPAILGFFKIERTQRTQLNAVHAQLLEKLRPMAFAQTCQVLTIQSLEFQNIGQKKRSSTA